MHSLQEEGTQWWTLLVFASRVETQEVWWQEEENYCHYSERFGSDLGDEKIVTTTGIKGKNSKASTSDFSQTIDNEEN